MINSAPPPRLKKTERGLISEAVRVILRLIALAINEYLSSGQTIFLKVRVFSGLDNASTESIVDQYTTDVMKSLKYAKSNWLDERDLIPAFQRNFKSFSTCWFGFSILTSKHP